VTFHTPQFLYFGLLILNLYKFCLHFAFFYRQSPLDGVKEKAYLIAATKPIVASSCRTGPPACVAWRAGTTTRRHSRLHPHSQGLRILLQICISLCSLSWTYGSVLFITDKVLTVYLDCGRILGGNWDNSLKGTVSRDFLLLVFFHESVSPRPQSIPLGPFRIFSKIRGDIRK
jgi:hypothetical protein